MAKVTVSAKTYTFTNGTANDATPVDASFNTLFNNDDALKTAVNHLEDGNLNETTTLTINAAYGGSSPSSNGVIQVERGTLGNPVLRWNETSDIWQASNNSTNYFPLLPPGYKDGCVLTYASASTVTVGRGRWADSTNTALIEVSSPLTLDLSAPGANGRDTGSENANTWYYVYLIMKSSDGTVAAVLSTTNEVVTGSITLPSGYDLKRQLPMAIRNDASSNIIPFFVGEGWPHRPKILYPYADVTSSYRVLALAGSGTTSFTAVSCTSFVPPISRIATLFGEHDDNGTTGSLSFRDSASSSSSGQEIAATTSGDANDKYEVDMTLDASQAFQYKTSSASNQASVFVKAFVVTEVS